MEHILSCLVFCRRKLLSFGIAHSAHKIDKGQVFFQFRFLELYENDCEIESNDTKLIRNLFIEFGIHCVRFDIRYIENVISSVLL